MEWQVEKLEYFRHVLHFQFNRGVKAAETARNICAVCGNNAIGESTAIKWFSRFEKNRFEKNRFDISDTPRPERPQEFDKDRLNT